MSKNNFKIQGFELTTSSKPFFIAEISANHLGKMENALKLVDEAVNSGANAIKLQTFTADSLTINCDEPDFFINDPDSLWHGRQLWDLYDEAHTPLEWHEPIFNLARKRGMACISSAFDASSIDFLVRIGVDAIKIASFEIVHTPLIEAAAKSSLPVILSTGMATLDEISDAVEILRNNNCENFALLQCTSAYPSTEENANIQTLVDMSKRFNCQTGLSDHCLRPFSVYAAVASGAKIVEKHIILSREEGGLDSAFSLEPHEFKEMVEGANFTHASMGLVKYSVARTEETSHKERPSIYVTEDIQKGELFTESNIRIIRPGFGLTPKNFRNILAKSAAQDLVRGTPLDWTMVE
mgnify:CR=1 FL=1